MNSYDDIIKKQAKMEPIILPEGFEERNDILINRLVADHIESSGRFNIFHYKASPIVLLIVLLFACGSAAAYTLSGGDFFKQFFAEKANKDPKNNYGYMNTEQLKDMASSTVGTVVDTDELAIDVMGVLTSGNTAKIMLRITAKKLDSVLYETGIEPLENYRFHDECSIPFDNFLIGSIGYIYSDKQKNLAPNQFEILFTLIGKESFGKGKYTMKLTDFGYFDFSRDDQFAPLYKRSWQFNIAFDSDSDLSKCIHVGEEAVFGNYSFTINSVNINPLACTISLKCNEDKAYIEKHMDEIYKAYSDECGKCSLTLKDGTTLSSGQFEVNPTGSVEGFLLFLTFKGPVTVDDVVSLTMLGKDYSLKQTGK
jgi:hypothetical protein